MWSLFTITLPTISWLFLLVGAISVIALRESQHKQKALLIISVACFFLLGLLRMEIASWSFGVSELSDDVGEVVVLQGDVIHEPDSRNDFSISISARATRSFG